MNINEIAQLMMIWSLSQQTIPQIHPVSLIEAIYMSGGKHDHICLSHVT